MPRKGPAVRRGITPDPVYQNPLVTQLVNNHKGIHVMMPKSALRGDGGAVGR